MDAMELFIKKHSGEEEESPHLNKIKLWNVANASRAIPIGHSQVETETLTSDIGRTSATPMPPPPWNFGRLIWSKMFWGGFGQLMWAGLDIPTIQLDPPPSSL